MESIKKFGRATKTEGEIFPNGSSRGEGLGIEVKILLGEGHDHGKDWNGKPARREAPAKRKPVVIFEKI